MRQPATILTLLVLALAPLPLIAQEPPPPDVPAPADLQELLRSQQELLDRQAKELELQRELLDRQRADLDAQRDAIQALRTQVDNLTLHATAESALTPEQAESLEAPGASDPAVDQPEAPADVLREGDFPGSIHLPGTNLNAKLGGFVRLGYVYSLDPIGSDDRFIVGSIPPEGEATAETEPRSTISAKRSRLNLDVRMDSSVGQFRAFLEGDFAGDGGSENYRLRHAYGQYNRLLLGQTWSSFMSTRAIPEDLDFEGLSAQINVRHPLMRWAGLELVGQNWAFSIEDPQPSLTGGNGSSKLGDLVTATSWTRDRYHLQLGALVRNLTGKPLLEDLTEGPEDSTFGYGVNLSGSLDLRRRNSEDNLRFQLNVGNGIGNYVNDLRSVGGQDGAFDPETGELRPLPVFAGYLAYQRWWRPVKSRFFRDLRSTLVYSYVYVDNHGFQDGGAYRATQRATANVMFSPISSLDIGGQILWGSRRDKDSSFGEAWQWQVVATFRF